MIITCYRAIPFSATTPTVGGVCWACEVLHDSRIVDMYPHYMWIEMEVAVPKTGAYVTSEDGGVATCFGEHDGWFSFPTDYIMKWRKVGDPKWKMGKGWKRYQRFYTSGNNYQKDEAVKASELLKAYGIDDIPDLIL